MNISLTPDLEMWVQELITAGRYVSASDLVQDAVRRMKDDLNPVLPGRPFTEAEMKELIQKRLDGRPPKPLDIEAVLDRADEIRAERRKAKHA